MKETGIIKLKMKLVDVDKLTDDVARILFDISMTEAVNRYICLVCKCSMAGKLNETEDKKRYLRCGVCKDCYSIVADDLKSLSERK